MGLPTGQYATLSPGPLHCVHVLFPSEHVWHVALGPHVVADGPAPGFVMQCVRSLHTEHPPLVLSWLHTPHCPPLDPPAIGYQSTFVQFCLPSNQQLVPEHAVHCTLMALHVVHVWFLAVHVPLAASARQYTVPPEGPLA